MYLPGETLTLDNTFIHLYFCAGFIFKTGYYVVVGLTSLHSFEIIIVD